MTSLNELVDCNKDSACGGGRITFLNRTDAQSDWRSSEYLEYGRYHVNEALKFCLLVDLRKVFYIPGTVLEK